MHYPDLPFSCSLNERLFDAIIKRTTWKERDSEYVLHAFRKKGARYMDVSRDGESYTVSFGGSNIFPLLTPEEEEQMIFILSLEN